ncbi:lamin tail domain-containing protein [Bacteroidota bacterium]
MKTTTERSIILLVSVIIIIYSTNLFSQQLPVFDRRIDMGLVECDEVVEASGIVASRKYQNVLWTHNDRNNQNRIFSLNTRGRHLGIYYLDGIDNRDWEDIAIGPGPVEGLSYLYIGNFGDNFAEYNLKYIYRIVEPEVSFNQESVETTIYDVETIILQYPDGVRDAETLLLDPITKDLYIISKREFEDIRVYRAPYPQLTNEVVIMEHVKTLLHSQLVGGDVSMTGNEILLKDYSTLFYWQRDTQKPLWEAFDTDPLILPYITEVQGEAVCWSNYETGYFTISEEPNGIPAHLYFYPRYLSSEVVVTEIMKDPLAVSDDKGEWIEIYNNSAGIVDLNGWIIKDLDTDIHTISQSLILQPEEYLVLGNNSNQDENGGVKIGYLYDNFSLDNTNDEILIVSPAGVLIDSVAYDIIIYPDPIGASMALFNPNMENETGLHWIEWTVPYGSGDRGSPGSPNIYEIPTLEIKDVQYTTDPSGDSPYLEQQVSLTGIVSVEPYGWSNKYFFIQDKMEKWSGISILHIDGVNKGDSVSFTGIVSEANNCLTMIREVYDFQVHKSGVEWIEPIAVTTGEIGAGGSNCEAYEGVMVRTEGICDTTNLGYREWSINDGSGSVRVYNVLFGGFSPELGNNYEVTGIHYSRDGEYKILPRFPENIREIVLGDEDYENIPGEFSLKQNFPNPFNPRTTIEYSIPKPQFVKLKIYDILGNKRETLINSKHPAGNFKVEFDASFYASGVYLFRLQTDEYCKTKKMIFLK